MRILVDGAETCTVSIERASSRFDCAVRTWANGATHAITLEGSAAWSLDYLEIATHHGRARDAFDAFVVPDGSTAYSTSGPFALWFPVVTGLLVLVTPARLPRWIRVTHRAVCGVYVVAAVAILLAELAGFHVVAARHTFLLAAGLMLLPQVVTVLATAVPAATHAVAAWHSRWMTPSRRRIAACALVAIAIVAAFHGIVRDRLRPSGGNHSALLVLSRTTFDGNPLVSHRQELRNTLALDDNGYDAQFMYYMALDPLLRTFKEDPHQYWRVVDAPAYRYGRIGFSWLAALFSLGRWQYLPAVMVWLVMAGLAMTGVGLARLAQQDGRTGAWGLLAFLVPGFWQSVQVCLPEPIIAALVVAGCAAAMKRHHAAAGVALGAALLFRETTAIVVLCLAGTMWYRGDRRLALVWLAATAAPVVCWRLYAASILYPALGDTAFFQNPQGFDLPFRGVWEMASRSWHGEYYGDYFPMRRAGIWYPLVLMAGLAAAVQLWWSRRSAVSAAACLYALMALSMSYDTVWGHVANGQRTSYELFVLLAVLTVTGAKPARSGERFVLAAFWVVTASYVFYGAFDAQFLLRSMADLSSSSPQ